MANFFKLPNERISRQNLFLGVGEILTLGLWGAQESPGRYLDIRVSNPAIASFADPLNSFRDWVIQQFRLRGNNTGRLRVEAVDRSGVVWDWIQVTVVEMGSSVTFAPKTQVYQAIQQGKMSFINPGDKANFLAAYEGRQIDGRTVRYSDELLAFLVSLLDQGRLTVLSLYRYNQSMHGDVLANGEVVCRAVDIAAYDGVPVTLTVPQQVIRVIVKIIDRMPAGLYQCGFPRPGGHEKFDPSKDVFFPVKDEATAMKCWNGTIAMDRSQLLSDAKAAVVPALQRAEARGASFKAMYPDGLNHFCVFALAK